MVNVDIKSLIKNDLPTFKRVLAIMEGKYTVPIITPGMTLDDVMYRSGQYSVLLHFKRLVAEAESDSNVTVI